MIFHSTIPRNRFLELFYRISHEMANVLKKDKDNPTQIFALLYFLNDKSNQWFNSIFICWSLSQEKGTKWSHVWREVFFSLFELHYARTFICIELIANCNQQFIFFHTLMASCASNLMINLYERNKCLISANFQCYKIEI